MALSHVVSEIFNVEKYRDLETPGKIQSRSLKVVRFDRLVWRLRFSSDADNVRLANVCIIIIIIIIISY